MVYSCIFKNIITLQPQNQCQMNETMNPWAITDQREIYDNPWINLIEYDVINPKGGQGIYGKVHFKNIAIGILPIDEDMNTYLVGQHRFVLNAYSWEIPEGGCPAGEDFLDGAKRELLEETGLVAGEWTEMLRMHLSNSVSDELAVIYLANDLTQHTPCPEDTEELIIKKIPFAEVITMVNEGQITDAMSIAAIQKLQLMLLKSDL